MSKIRIAMSSLLIALSFAALSASAQQNLSGSLGRFGTLSTNDAQTAEYCLGVAYWLWPLGAQIDYVQPGSAAEGNLEVGDWIIAALYDIGGGQVEIKVIGSDTYHIDLADAVKRAAAPHFEMLISRKGELSVVSVELQPCHNKGGKDEKRTPTTRRSA